MISLADGLLPTAAAQGVGTAEKTQRGSVPTRSALRMCEMVRHIGQLHTATQIGHLTSRRLPDLHRPCASHKRLKYLYKNILLFYLK